MKSKTLTDDNDRPKVKTQNLLDSTDQTKTNLHLGIQYDLISKSNNYSQTIKLLTNIDNSVPISIVWGKTR